MKFFISFVVGQQWSANNCPQIYFIHNSTLKVIFLWEMFPKVKDKINGLMSTKVSPVH